MAMIHTVSLPDRPLPTSHSHQYIFNLNYLTLRTGYSWRRHPPADATSAPKPVLLYNPESIQAAVGDTVKFVFMQANHSVTQSTFANPCVKMAGGVDSGLLPNPNGAPGVEWTTTVNSTEATWFYCKQRTNTHCGKGMVFAINAATTGDKTFAAYKQLAIAQNGTALSSAPIQAPAPPTAAQSTVVVEATSTTVAVVHSSTPAVPVQGSSTVAAGAPAAGASVVPGQGSMGDGGACSCSCLCGVGSVTPQGAGVDHFGGYAGMMPKLS
ncbi:hypothetical protein H2199_004934 [Coniosporium tulheliwenetii]|uniref:Uncharacterized protein n=1 Tax=Coniosporium tulheliwenetii TaxID=3383036 RepID=A0ACC2Z5Q3_9PEZI|nr:hypothetical protein H2199_004934 [Cladosporium sp. JES 115]